MSLVLLQNAFVINAAVVVTAAKLIVLYISNECKFVFSLLNLVIVAFVMVLYLLMNCWCESN